MSVASLIMESAEIQILISLIYQTKFTKLPSLNMHTQSTLKDTQAPKNLDIIHNINNKTCSYD